MKKRNSISGIRGGSIAYKPELDGLRAIAVAAVVAFHLEKFKAGFLGVDIFFVLSGYLITRVLISNFGQRNLFSNFYIRRYFRLFPVLLMNIVVSAILLFLIDKRVYSEYMFRAVFYIRNIFSSTSQGHDLWEHTWSLSSEEQFYLIYPIILFVFWKKIRNPIYLSFVYLAYFVLCQLFNQSSPDFLLFGILKLSVITRPSGLALGCAIGVLSHLTISPKRHFLLLLYLLCLASGVAAIRMESTFWVDLMTAGLILSLEPFVASRPRNILFKILSTRPLPYLGRLSYSIYMWHPITIFTVFHYWHQPSLFRGLFVMSLTLMVSALSFHFLELPISRNLGRRFI